MQLHIGVHNINAIRAFLEQTEPVATVTCNTQKDRGVRLNHITSGSQPMAIMYRFFHIVCCYYPIGILAGAWPCGIIVIVSELFRAESKSQVYASLHQYFSDYPSVLDKLGS